ncbi:MAG TPA: Maf family protein [Acetobacteraceae bacterium]|nr:Maf family protein [Acetobacteraceae bacterium]
MMQRPIPGLILASASGSRRSLLEAAGLVFAVLPAGIDEVAVKGQARAAGVSAEATALCLADLKAAQVARGNPEALVIGADQILVCDGAWFDKPADMRAAAAQLRALRGRTHSLATAVTCHQGATRVWHALASPHLTMRHFSEQFLESYLELEGAAVTSTVGAYRLEGRGVLLFKAVEGEHSAVLGLPLLPLLDFLREQQVLIE